MTEEFLVEMCKSCFVSGHESANGNILKKYFEPYTDYLERDKLGSYIFKSNGINNHKIMLSAHIDEIGLIVTGILEGGFLSITAVGRINPLSLVAQQVIVYGKTPIIGVIGINPPQITTEEERAKSIEINELYIDTGYTEEYIKSIVEIGDVAVVNREPEKLIGSVITAKALDDHAGVAVMYETAKELNKISHKSNIYYAATVQEEVGCRGAYTAAYTVNPDIGIVLDVSFAFTPELNPDSTISIGRGMGICICDRSNPMLTKKIIEVCQKYNYKFQYEVFSGNSGSDAEGLQISRQGVPCIMLSIPLRYMHTSAEIVDLDDIETLGCAIARFINEIDNSDMEELLCF